MAVVINSFNRVLVEAILFVILGLTGIIFAYCRFKPDHDITGVINAQKLLYPVTYCCRGIYTWLFHRDKMFLPQRGSEGKFV
ncbi:MAG TPA: hypothetical protein ENG51_19430 [Deltaproteobacteria bacterium]|nr:hypothetical protein [Deltaproteobacteria bacterium]